MIPILSTRTLSHGRLTDLPRFTCHGCGEPLDVLFCTDRTWRWTGYGGQRKVQKELWLWPGQLCGCWGRSLRKSAGREAGRGEMGHQDRPCAGEDFCEEAGPGVWEEEDEMGWSAQGWAAAGGWAHRPSLYPQPTPAEWLAVSHGTAWGWGAGQGFPCRASPDRSAVPGTPEAQVLDCPKCPPRHSALGGLS